MRECGEMNRTGHKQSCVFCAEFVVDPKSVITERIALYYQAIEVAEQEGNKTRVKTLQDGIEVVAGSEV